MVWSNKWVAKNGFRWMSVLTLGHLATTFFVFESGARIGLFPKKKPKNLFSIVPISGAFILYIVMGNLSLKYNTVG